MMMEMKSKGSSKMKKPKVVFIMGATGTGKSKLSVDIARRFPAEIINSDKIQAYRGLDIVTNKLPEAERAGVPHHLLGVIPDPAFDFTPAHFRARARESATAIAARGNTPLVVGGSNSYLEALVDAAFLAAFDCLFLWLDADLAVLFGYVDERVDQMVADGLVDEVREFFEPGADLSRGIWRAIGVPEMAKCFSAEEAADEEGSVAAAIAETKSNTRRLVLRQTEKIRRLRDEAGWELRRIDATEVFERRADAAAKEAAWEEAVLGPSLKMVEEFLKEEEEDDDDDEDEGCSDEMKIQSSDNKASAADQFLSSSPIFVL